MDGVLVQLVAFGAEDIAITGYPEITYFKTIYRRHTMLSMEAFQNNFIDVAMLKSMQSMCGFRNIAIHEYKKLKKEMLKFRKPFTLDDLVLCWMKNAAKCDN